MTNGTLFQPLNLTNLILQNSYVISMALGMLLVIVAGHIDLSVGSVVGFVGYVKAAKLSDIKTERLTFYTFMNMGVLAALAGLVFAARLNTAWV